MFIFVGMEKQGKKIFVGLSLDSLLVKDIDKIAKKEVRSRTGQIELILREYLNKKK